MYNYDNGNAYCYSSVDLGIWWKNSRSHESYSDFSMHYDYHIYGISSCCNFIKKICSHSCREQKIAYCPKVISIVIPLYNKEVIVARSVGSVLSQSYRDLELIVVDDGSTDGSVAVVEGIHDERIRLIRQPNGGPSKARNTGVEHARGEWILFLDADDELADGALEHLLNVASKHPEANVIDGSFIVRTGKSERLYIHAENRFMNNNFKAFFYRDTLPRTGNSIFKTTLIQLYPYNTKIRRYEDVELLMRLLKEARIVTTSRPIFCVNSAYASASTTRPSISEDFLGHLDFNGKSFWERMCLYQFYLWERENYPDAVNKLYPTLRWRIDMTLLIKFLHKYKRFI